VNAEDLVARYCEAMARNDSAALTRLRHPDWHEDWPQSGERVPSDEAYREIHDAFPGGLPQVDVRQVEGTDDRWVVTPSMTVERIAGSGDVWLVEGVNTYQGGDVYHVAMHIRLRDGRVWRTTTYFAAPFEAPAWRAGLVVPID
jgi:hypothetical protein